MHQALWSLTIIFHITLFLHQNTVPLLLISDELQLTYEGHVTSVMLCGEVYA